MHQEPPRKYLRTWWSPSVWNTCFARRDVTTPRPANKRHLPRTVRRYRTRGAGHHRGGDLFGSRLAERLRLERGIRRADGEGEGGVECDSLNLRMTSMPVLAVWSCVLHAPVNVKCVFPTLTCGFFVFRVVSAPPPSSSRLPPTNCQRQTATNQLPPRNFHPQTATNQDKLTNFQPQLCQYDLRGRRSTWCSPEGRMYSLPCRFRWEVAPHR